MTNNPDITFSRDKLKLFFLLLALVSFSQKMFALGEANFVQDVSSPGGFALFDKNPAAILVGTNDWPGVVRAADDLAADINRVTGKSPKIFNNSKSAGKNVVIIGTVGKSEFIDRLIRERKLTFPQSATNGNRFFYKSCRTRFRE